MTALLNLNMALDETEDAPVQVTRSHSCFPFSMSSLSSKHMNLSQDFSSFLTKEP
jgi:hypothetical protein